jgi:hypothetical protein
VLEQVGSHFVLWQVSGDSYDRWIQLNDQFPVSKIPGYVSVLDPQHFWLSYWVSFQADPPDPGTKLFATADGGRHWERVEPPKPCNFYPTTISPLNAHEIWIGCGLAAGAGAGISAAFESADGGKSWMERRQDTRGYFLNLQALSKSLVVMTYGSLPMITYDGGRTWKNTPIQCPFEDAFTDFVDKSYGWVACLGNVYRTTDSGRSWECTRLADNKPCDWPIISTPTP